MNVTVLETSGMPSDSEAYMAIRCGDNKRLRPFSVGETFAFPAAANTFQIDAYAKLASNWLSFDEAVPADGSVRDIVMRTATGSELTAKLKVSGTGADSTMDKKSGMQSRHKFALEAKSYMDLHDVAGVVQGMLNAILKEQPMDPVQFMLQFLEGELQDRQSTQAKADEQKLAKDPIQLSLPDLSAHHSLTAALLRDEPSIWDKLVTSQSDGGSRFIDCLQPGLVLPGHPSIAAVGAMAGDASCYNDFEMFFNPLLQRLTGWDLSSNHPIDTSLAGISPASIDATGRYALSARVRCRRCIQGIRFPPACDANERSEVERLLSKVLARLEDEDLYGEYFPLVGSTSFVPKPQGMTEEEELDLRHSHLLFGKPTGKAQVAAGLARDWPHARGVFAAESRKFAAWCNEEDHLQLMSLDLGSDLRGVFERLTRATAKLESALQSCGHEFARHERLGYLTASPANVGSGMRASLMLNVPRLLAAAGETLPEVGQRMQLQVIKLGGSTLGNGLCEVTNLLRLGTSEVAQVNTVLQGASALVQLERLLEAGSSYEEASARILG
mmetsp:Transcript_6776/g.11915  ORF Transcript_6776/g.11915 Transcript_6776/m.11915 type:complete len:556 (+) Transcript_6776:57-1724(+)